MSLPTVAGPAVDSFCVIAAAVSLFFLACLDHRVLTGVVLLIVLILLFLLVRGMR